MKHGESHACNVSGMALGPGGRWGRAYMHDNPSQGNGMLFVMKMWAICFGNGIFPCHKRE